jgi:hypothetical protein
VLVASIDFFESLRFFEPSGSRVALDTCVTGSFAGVVSFAFDIMS